MNPVVIGLQEAVVVTIGDERNVLSAHMNEEITKNNAKTEGGEEEKIRKKRWW